MTVKQMIKRAPKEADSIYYDGNGCAWYFKRGTNMMCDRINKEGMPLTPIGDNEGMFLSYKLDNGKWFIYRNRYSEASKKLIELGYKWNDSTGWAIDK